MDKPLSDKEKTEDAPESGRPEGALALKPDLTTTSIGAYAPHSNHAAELTAKPWNSTPQGRLAIRAVTRGVMGAAFFTAGGLLTRKWMHTGTRYDRNTSLFEQENPLRIVAKIIDSTVSKPIFWTVKNIAGEEAAHHAINFRPTRYRGDFKNTGYYGRTLGNEAVSVTFDFFCASVGDAWGRDIAAFIDPNVKKDWIKNGRIDVPQAVKTMVKSVGRYVTYNGGEDWAVAIPYAYYMKGQRALINHFSPGFIYDSDRQLNGGSFKMNQNHEIVGNFNKEGMIDLQGRFTAYNIGTLMYREVYNYIRDRLHGKGAALYGAPDKTGKQTMGENLSHLGKWMARSVIKGVIYMTPSVPLFWITRTPQTKHRGLFINQDGDALGYELTTSHGVKRDVVFANDSDLSPHQTMDYAYRTRGNSRVPLSERNASYSTQYTIKNNGPASLFSPVHEGKHFDPHGQAFGAVDSVFNTIGGLNNQTKYILDKPAEWADKKFWAKPVKNALGMYEKLPNGEKKWNPFTRFTHPYLNAAIAYTPYMYGKAEASRLLDHGGMDMAIERMIDGATSLKWGEFTAGASEVGRMIMQQPLADPVRQAEAERRKKMDTSPPVDVNLEDKGYSNLTRKFFSQPGASWQERTIVGRPPEKEETAASQVTPKPASYVDQEELRKALIELNPPTNSRH